MKHIKLFESFEELEEGNNARLKSVIGIIKSLKSADKYDGKTMYNLINWSTAIQDMRSGFSTEESDLVYTPGNFPWTDRGRDNLEKKTLDRLQEVLNKDSELRSMYDEYINKLDKEKEEKKQAEIQAKLEKEQKERQEKTDFLSSLDGATILYDYLEKYGWYVRRNPWSVPKLERTDKDHLIDDKEMEAGKHYVLKRGTLYPEDGNQHNKGLLFGSIVEYLGNGKVRPVLEQGMYGPSIWTKVYVKPSEWRFSGNGWELSDFMKNNGTALENVIQELNKRIADYREAHGESAPEFDPNWGMN